jgi:hypothetical protein
MRCIGCETRWPAGALAGAVFLAVWLWPGRFRQVNLVGERRRVRGRGASTGDSRARSVQGAIRRYGM